MSTRCGKRGLVLLIASMLVEVDLASNVSPFLDELATNATTTVIDSTTTVPTFTFPPGDDDGPLADITTGKVIILLLISFSLPVAFMLLLFWRLRKENKYLHSRALRYYRDTVLVPRGHRSEDNESNHEDQYAVNVTQMYSTLYDTPPNYEEIVRPTTEPNEQTTQTHGSSEKSEKLEDLSPPAYSTVYM